MSGRLSSTFETFAERAGEQVSKALRWFFGLFTRLVSKAPFSRQTPLIALGMLVGLVAGVVSALFNWMIEEFDHLSWDVVAPLIANIDVVDPGAWTFLASALPPALGGLLVGFIVWRFPKDAKGHGVAEVMEAVAVKGSVIAPRTILTRSLVASLTIGSGGSVGPEGPIMHIGSAVGSTIGQVLRLPGSALRVLVGCGAAAGMAAFFNAPLAGVIFAIELVLGEFNVNSFSPIIAASVFATAIQRALSGDVPTFIVPPYEVVSARELLLYLGLGVLCGFIAPAFVKTLEAAETAFQRLERLPVWARPALGGFLVGGIGFFFPEVLGDGTHVMNEAIRGGSMAWTLMVALVFLKMIATSITLGSGASGGTFAPSLFIGAMAGGAFGTLVNALFPDMTAGPGSYALVGMAACAAAAAHAPMTMIVMLFELTANYKSILPLMIACIIAASIARGVSIDSIYTGRLRRRGINIVEGREVGVLASLYVSEAMHPGAECVPETMTLRELKRFITGSTHTNFPMVDAEGKLSGLLSIQDFRAVAYEDALEDIVVAGEIAVRDAPTVLASENLNTALNRMGERNTELLPVVDPSDARRVVGVLSRRDIINAYARALVLRRAHEEGSAA